MKSLNNRVEKLEEKNTPRREFIPENLSELYNLETTSGTPENIALKDLYNPHRYESKQ